MIDIGHEAISANYVWKPDRREIDALMLAEGFDPTAASYFDDAGLAMKKLYGIAVAYSVAAEYVTADFGALVKSAAASGKNPAGAGALLAVQVVNQGVKQGLLQSAIAGTLDGRTAVDLGTYSVKVTL